MADAFLIESMARYIGQTVTIFTTSGGLSGSGFTGVLAGISESYVKLITNIGAPPTCPIGSTCMYGENAALYNAGLWNGFYPAPAVAAANTGYNNGWGCCGGGGGAVEPVYPWGYNWLGSVTEIPICRIASFTHNAI